MGSRHTPLISRMVALACVFSLAGCLEYETTTTVHPDGSLTRSITVNGDSSAIYGWDFKVPADSTWKVLERIKVGDKKWTLKAERNFSGADAWNTWSEGLERRTLRCSVLVETRFRFFTTKYRYTEIIHAFNPFTRIPITDYISPSELEAFRRFEVLKESYPTRGDSLALDDAGDRFEEWERRTRAESFYAAMIRDLPASILSDSSQLADIKKELLDHYVDENENSNFELKAFKKWARTLRNPALMHAIDANWAEFERLAKDIEFVQDVGGDSYTSRVEMPGELTATNGTREGPSIATWEDYIAFAYVRDFTMMAESSVVNVWAIVLTLGVIVGIPILVWGGSMRRKRGNTKG